MPRRTCTLLTSQIAAICGSMVVRVADLERLGLHRATIAHRCRPAGPWQSICPGVVLLHNAPSTRDDRRRAGLCHAGTDALITGLDALDLHGMRCVPRPYGPVHILSPPERRVTGHGLVLVERTTRLPEPVPGRWPLAPLPRAVLDFARRSGDRNQARAAIAEVVQRRRCTPVELASELAAGSQRRSKLVRDILREVGDGVRSVAEAKARELIHRSSLPRPMWNPRLVDARTGRFIAAPDAWFDEVCLAWEIDSYEWHLSPAEYDHTLTRRVRMTSEGIHVVSHPPNRLISQGPTVIDELARNLAQAALRPRPMIRAIPADQTSGTFVG